MNVKSNAIKAFDLICLSSDIGRYLSISRCTPSRVNEVEAIELRPDAMNEAEELFGIERLVETANKYSDSSSKEMIDSIFGELSRHMGDRPQYDDITMLLLKFTK